VIDATRTFLKIQEDGYRHIGICRDIISDVQHGVRQGVWKFTFKLVNIYYVVGLKKLKPFVKIQYGGNLNHDFRHNALST